MDSLLPLAKKVGEKLKAWRSIGSFAAAPACHPGANESRSAR